MRQIFNRIFWVSLSVIISVSICSAQNEHTENKSVTVNGNSYSITQSAPGTLLKYVPATKIEHIDSLTVIGLMDERDFTYINHMENLKYLDLSSAYVTYEPSRKKDVKRDIEARKAISNILGEAVEAKRKEGKMDDLNYAANQVLVELMKASTDVNIDSDPCFLPKIENLKKLETVKMPRLAEWLDPNCFKDCRSLNILEWPENLKNISGGCFQNTAIKVLKFPSSLEHIKLTSWYDKTTFAGCDSITAVSFRDCINMSDFDPSNSAEVNLSYLEKALPNLTHIELSPNWRNRVRLGTWANKMIYYFIPSKLEEIYIDSRVAPVLVFDSPLPPDRFIAPEGLIWIYVPQGSLDDYYAAIGLDYKDVKFIEYRKDGDRYIAIEKSEE